MLFLEKENIFRLFGCLRIHFTENQFRFLVRSNIFTENALHSQATQFSIHFLSCKHVENESIPHSLTKETKPSKKIHQIRSNWEKKEERATGFDRWRRMRDRAAKARSSGVGVGLVRSTIWCDRRTGAIVDLVRSSDWCHRRSGAIVDLLSLSVSLFACGPEMARRSRWSVTGFDEGGFEWSERCNRLAPMRSSCSNVGDLLALSLFLSSIFQGRKSFEVKMKT